MLADLRADSVRWRQEQRSTGTRGSRSPVVLDKTGFTVPDLYLGEYGDSKTHHQSNGRGVPRRDADSPALEGQYGGAPSRERLPAAREERRAQPVDPMQIDPPIPQPDRRYAQQQQPGRGGYPPEPRFPPVQDNRSYPPDAMMSDAYGRPPVTSSYVQGPGYAPSYPQPPNDGGMPAFGRQPPPGNYYTPVSSSYDAMPSMPGRPQDNIPYGGGPPIYGQPQQQPQQPQRQEYRDQRDPRDSREPRYGGREYDPSHAYPSPAATISTPRERDQVTSPGQSRFASSRPYHC